MSVEFVRQAQAKGIKYFLISFTDLFGVVRSKLAPLSAMEDMIEEGAGFAGFAAHLDMTPAHPDMFAMPEIDRMIQLPWKPEVGWVPSDVHMDGKVVEHGPRATLKRVLETAESSGYSVMSGVEPEFFVLSPDGESLADPSDIRGKPCYDQQALMRRYDLISEICDAMLSLEWEPYQNDHEDANGQFEMNWGFSDALTTADRHTFFKIMVKSLAEKHGLRATFMPKPMPLLTGNGCHVHLSLWSRGGENQMKGQGELGLSELAYHCIGGLLSNARSVALITNPVVNSYKRINAPRTHSGATWSPNTVTYGGNNRTHMIRIPGDNRIEVRLADGAANPYLLQAAVAAASLDGIKSKADPGKRLDIDMYAESASAVDAPKLPLNMLDAIRLFEEAGMPREYFGEEFCTALAKLKNDEWNEYMRHFSAWERENALDI
ncbi:MAG: type III glutamate--ammonia ligase [Albidovulum sp.]|nr:type III glutamate--ammonia ligase [Albidovulum sp.]MDE0530603.1 type III glutamate--ammonia ligase [Albidovulum sp.]